MNRRRRVFLLFIAPALLHSLLVAQEPVQGLPGLIAPFSFVYPAFFSIPARDGFPMPAQILMPTRPVQGRKYPVILFVYSGPSAPVVLDVWQREIYWENLLLQNGYIVFRCDNRSATGISKALETTGARRLEGLSELSDIIDAVQWLKSQAYVDSTYRMRGDSPMS
ncbi:MAG TPA: prolyl oligopeptidase family serine peptidase [Bacteroidota bacterium]